MMTQDQKRKFVFVVCGDDEQLRRLHLSLGILKKYTKSPIIVVTDLSKNQGKIRHDTVISVSTPPNLDAHQSSIFLKTSLHHHLDMKHLYAYLDTDMIARSKKVDQVFDQFSEPVSFARDYVDIQHFSPVAVKCGCQEQFRDHEKILTGLFKKYDPNYARIRDEKNRKKITRIEQLDKAFKKNFRWKILRKWRQWFDPEHLHLTDFTHYVTAKSGYTWDDETRTWFDEDGTVIYSLDSGYRAQIEELGDYLFDESLNAWKTTDGLVTNDVKCTHLQDAIVEKIGVRIPDQWRHWNGGLFLFNKQSVEFLEDWHQLTIGTFPDPDWVTRDQGTLAATVWKHELQENAPIPIELNFILTLKFGNARYLGKNQFIQSSSREKVKPVFVHLIDGITSSTEYFWGIGQKDGQS
ncbi:MAG: hypothetical protein HQ510_01030 [Candidatus Marinimicrobia bacterium]|nr:hypothetical protein [Candidatus Neomarinimicrobiota bacterium]